MPHFNLDLEFKTDGILSFSEEEKSNMLLYALSNLIGYYAGYQSYSEYDKVKFVLNDQSFDYIWNQNTSLREPLFFIMLSLASGRPPYHSRHSLTKEFVVERLQHIEKELSKNTDETSDNTVRRIVSTIHKDYDYTAKIKEIINSEDRASQLNNWIELALENSSKEEEFEFLLSNIKKSSGSLELKTKIVKAAFDKEILCKKTIEKISKSSHISIRRLCVGRLVEIVSKTRYRLAYSTSNKDVLKGRYDEAYNLMMMFSSIPDRNIVSSLSSSVEVKDLPWILPAASKFPWIAGRIQERIDKGV